MKIKAKSPAVKTMTTATTIPTIFATEPGDLSCSELPSRAEEFNVPDAPEFDVEIEMCVVIGVGVVLIVVFAFAAFVINVVGVVMG